jgi:hypothetical protein
MTDRGALPYEDLGGWLTEDLFPGWAAYWNEAPAAPPKPPWYRNTRVLVTIITAAVAALVMAGAALVALGSPGFTPTRPMGEIIPRTSTPVIPATGSDSPGSDSPGSAPQTPADVTSRAESTDAPKPALSPAESAAPPDLPTREAPAPDSRRSDGPRINVTRTPMSFAPASGN